MTTPAMKSEIDLHYTSISGCPLSSNWKNGRKDDLGTNTFHMHPLGFVVFLDSAQVLACGVIHAHMKE